MSPVPAADPIASYLRIVTEMRKTIDAMDQDDRDSLLDAAAVMRRVRAGSHRQLRIEPTKSVRKQDDC